MKGLIIYSSKTGNTEKVCHSVYDHLCSNYVMTYKSAEDFLAENENNFDNFIAEFDFVFIGFWADKGTADEKARLVISNIKNSKVGILGTLGAYPDSDHCKEMQERVASLVRDNGNQVLGTFMSMGKVDPRLIEAFKQVTEGHPQTLND